MNLILYFILCLIGGFLYILPFVLYISFDIFYFISHYKVFYIFFNLFGLFFLIFTYGKYLDLVDDIIWKIVKVCRKDKDIVFRVFDNKF